jgi:hypothetical protein
VNSLLVSSLSTNSFTTSSIYFSSAQGGVLSTILTQTSTVYANTGNYSSFAIRDSGNTYNLTVQSNVLYFTSTPITGAQYLRFEYVTLS